MGQYVPVRDYFAGMGEAVADRTVNRQIFTEWQRAMLPEVLVLTEKDPDFKAWRVAAELSDYPFEVVEDADFMEGQPELRRETWQEVARRVAEGNTLLAFDKMDGDTFANEFATMRDHLASGTLLMSGRHLQHGDRRQASRPMEVFTNCSTAATSFLLFYLLLNGSGVGRSYDDAMIKVDWNKMPTVYTAIANDHPDRFKTTLNKETGQFEPLIPQDVRSREWYEAHFARGEIMDDPTKITFYEIQDSRGGWAKGLEQMERMAFEGRSDEVLVLVYDKVRGFGEPIKGMQYRPSSGPAPVMAAMRKIAAIKFMGLDPWMAAMFVDHYASECVLVGGARRAARMAIKFWKDRTIFKFIRIKRDHALWSSNNSVGIDQEFRDAVKKVVGLLTSKPGTPLADTEASELQIAGEITDDELHAYRVLIEIARASYFDGTGEPGIINQDRLHVNDNGVEDYLDGQFAGSRDFKLDPESLDMTRALAKALLSVKYIMIVNPCAEIAILMLGGYCVIADVVPFHAKDDDMAESAFRTAVRALMRTNLMDSLYNREVKRTNRIGVGMTGFHEWVYDRFGFTWKDIVNERKSKKMWLTLSRFKRAVVEEAAVYARLLGVEIPHTNTTFKPAGTTSKLFGLSEGAHLPSMRWYLRWVQFRNDDPLIEKYEALGYPVRRDLKTYDNTTIVGFPTAPTICQLGDGEWVTTAAEATPEQQYEFLRLIEKYWIVGVAEDGKTPLENTGNQVSYTLKFKPSEVNFDQFLKALIDGQFTIRCCSVMPQVDTTSYEYQPEEPITKDEYDRLMAAISNDNVKEDVDFSHIDCGSGACPVDFSDEDKKAA